MDRHDLHALARLRLREARALRDRHLWCGCYYLVGHAVECALKACIAKATRRHDFPDKTRANQSHTHDLRELLKLAALDHVLETDAKTHPALGVNWTVVKDWKVETRYNRSVPAQAARDLYRAATQRQTGIIPWLRQRW
jgi:hypothetical protein